MQAWARVLHKRVKVICYLACKNLLHLRAAARKLGEELFSYIEFNASFSLCFFSGNLSWLYGDLTPFSCILDLSAYDESVDETEKTV